MHNWFNSLKDTWLNFSWTKRGLVIFFLITLIWGIYNSVDVLLQRITIEEPVAGGTLRLGIVGRPLLKNPILSSDNEGDREIINLVYNGLFRIGEGGKILPDLAEKVEISPDERTYTVFLKDNILWHDGTPFSADDVVFTIETIQDPDIKSPLNLNWRGVVVEKLADNIVRFNLRNPYVPFLQNLTVKIIPKHIWENIEAVNFPHAEYNSKPIGTGPYIFESLEKLKTGKIVSYNLVANQSYHRGAPYISHISLLFYDNYDEAKTALLRGDVEGLNSVALEDADFFQQKRKYRLVKILSPRYYAVFLNLKKDIFSLPLRKALDLAIDREKLVKEILHNQAIELNSPFVPQIFPVSNSSPQYSLKKAQQLIKQNTKKDKELKFKLLVPENKTLINVANFLINSWRNIGLSPELQIVPSSILTKEIIEKRNYDALLFGEEIGIIPDLFPFWHSSQKEPPGLNLSNYSNSRLDKLVEEIRTITEEDKRRQDFIEIQKILNEDKPALFLYNSYHLFLLPRKVQGNSISIVNFPSEKFSDIEKWYIKTKRRISFSTLKEKNF